MRKILFTASTFSHIRAFHLPYIRRLRQMGFEVHIACGGDLSSAEHSEVDNVRNSTGHEKSGEEFPHEWERLVYLPFCKKIFALDNFRATLVLRRLIKKEGYDIVITHTTLASFFTRLAVRMISAGKVNDNYQRPKVINVVHGYLFDDKTLFIKRSILLFAERIMARHTDLVLTMNQYDYDVAKKYALAQRIEKIAGMGVDFSTLDASSSQERSLLRAKLGIKEKDFVFIYPAEFSKGKSQRVLIYAMKKLPQNAILLLAGDGRLRKKCEKLAKKLEIDGRVCFLGHVTPISKWYRVADAAVASSRKEGLPFNVMEAIYMGLPIVASDVKGHKDLISHGVNGLLYPYGDSDICASLMQRLMESTELCTRLAQNSHFSMKDYAFDNVSAQVIEKYLSL